jgi:hypothetical protein
MAAGVAVDYLGQTIGRLRLREELRRTALGAQSPQAQVEWTLPGRGRDIVFRRTAAGCRAAPGS